MIQDGARVPETAYDSFARPESSVNRFNSEILIRIAAKVAEKYVKAKHKQFYKTNLQTEQGLTRRAGRISFLGAGRLRAQQRQVSIDLLNIYFTNPFYF